MSLMATSFRFEIESCNAKQLRNALNRQAMRVKEDEKYADRLNTEESNARVNEVSRWSESLEESWERRTVKREKQAINEELRFGKTALVKVRRAQLKKLLEEESQQYEKELAALGKAFYKERQ